MMSSSLRFLFSFLLVSTAQAVCYTTAQNEAWCGQTSQNKYDCGTDRRCYWLGFDDWSGTCKAKQTCTAATTFQCQALQHKMRRGVDKPSKIIDMIVVMTEGAIGWALTIGVVLAKQKKPALITWR